MKRYFVLTAAVAGLLVLTGCAPQASVPAGSGADLAGFFLGWWHGFTMLFTFIVSLFNHNVGIYEVDNSGGWYDFGYLLGVMSFFGGGGGSAAGARR